MQTTSASAFSTKPNSSPATSLPGALPLRNLAVGAVEQAWSQRVHRVRPELAGSRHDRKLRLQALVFASAILIGHGIVASGMRPQHWTRAEIFNHVPDALLDLVELLIFQCIQSRIRLRRSDHRDENRIVKRGE